MKAAAIFLMGRAKHNMSQGGKQSLEAGDETVLISVFGLNLGAGHAMFHGPLVRQATDDLARALSAFEGITARAHHLLRPAAPVDPNLDEEALQEDAIETRVGFLMRQQLPPGGELRRQMAQQGGSVALTGRLGITRDDVALALNLWDVRQPDLLWCHLRTSAPEDLPGMLIEATAKAAFALQSAGAGTLSEARLVARAAVGTTSMDAYEALAAATEKLRRRQLGLGQSANPVPILQALGQALVHDPDYEPPRLLMMELAMERLMEADRACAEALDEICDRLHGHLVYGLLRFEALLVLDEPEEAAACLKSLGAEHGTSPALAQAKARLSAHTSAK